VNDDDGWEGDGSDGGGNVVDDDGDLHGASWSTDGHEDDNEDGWEGDGSDVAWGNGDGRGDEDDDGDRDGDDDGRDEDDDENGRDDGDAVWGDDGHGDKDDDARPTDGHDYDDDDENDENSVYGEALVTKFTYTVDTDGRVDPEEVIAPLENAILDDVSDYVEGSDDFRSFTGKITARPEDYAVADEWCGDGNAVRCSVVKGGMSFYIYENGQGARDNTNIDVCKAGNIIKTSMEGKDYSDVDGVTNAQYRNSDDDGCGLIIGGAAGFVPVAAEDDGIGAGAAFGMLAAAAALGALAFFATRKMGRRRNKEDDRGEGTVVVAPAIGDFGEMGSMGENGQEMSLISNDLDGSSFLDSPREDPYASTIDVHKCTSIYCSTCNNKSLSEPRFLAVPRKVDMPKTMMANGISPTGVNQADSEFFDEDPALDTTADSSELEEDAFDAGEQQARGHNDRSTMKQGSIMRVPIFQQEGDRPLTPVNEIANDSEFDTEISDDEGTEMDGSTTIPPPPPLNFHPAYRQGTGDVQLTDSNDEISI